MRRIGARTVWPVTGALALVLGMVATAVWIGGSDGAKELPNALETAWSRTIRPAPSAPDEPLALGDAALAVPHGRQLTVVDTRTGHLRARVSSHTDTFDRAGFAGDVLLASTTREDGTHFLRGYDAATGRELWHLALSGETRIIEPGDADELPLSVLVATDRGAVIYLEDGRVLGVSLRSGTIRWRDTAPTSCAHEVGASPFNVAATRRYAVRLDHCQGEPLTVEAIDPEDGGRVWRRRLAGHGNSGSKLVSVGDTIQADSNDRAGLDDDYWIFAEDGGQLLHGKGQALLGRHGDTVYLQQKNWPGMQGHMSAVRTGTGETVWRHPSAGGGKPGDGAIAAYWTDEQGPDAGDARRQAPGASDLTDFTGRRGPHVTWPVAGEVVGMRGRLLIVASSVKGGKRYTALRPVHRSMPPGRPPALAGVAPRAWPDACALLGDAYLEGLAEDYARLPLKASHTVLDTRLPHPSVCRFARASGTDDEIFTVTVRWVAPTAEAARTFAESAVPWQDAAQGGTRAPAVTEPRPGVRLSLYTTRIDEEGREVANATVTNGRWVLGVSASGDEESHRSLTRRVALHLSRLDAPGA